MSDTMNETHIHDPRPLARSEIESVLQLSRETAYVPSEDRPGIKDKSFVKRPLVDVARAADAPVTPDTSEVSNVSATPAIPEEAKISQNLEVESAPTPGNLDAVADESVAIPERVTAGDTDLVSGETPAGTEDLQAIADGEEKPLPTSFQSKLVTNETIQNAIADTAANADPANNIPLVKIDSAYQIFPNVYFNISNGDLYIKKKAKMTKRIPLMHLV